MTQSILALLVQMHISLDAAFIEFDVKVTLNKYFRLFLRLFLTKFHLIFNGEALM
ncbi:hypothetical protein [Chlorogloeopsis sp. ULAP02]|uniref:hypothetical protein n=1 Tax=Chlorogloeopsis sp. ULAP02 TaxID=3107926 RepID=UPI00398B048B